MKTLITNYSFDASAKTVTLTGLTSTLLEQVLLITNVTDNIIIYNFANPLLGGSIASGVITLTYDTTSMADADDLQIFIDDLVAEQTDALTDTQLRATAVPVSVTGVATSAKQDTIIGHLDGVETILTAVETATEAIQAGQLPDSHNVTVDNASIAVTNAGITTIAGAVSGSEMQVDVLTMPTVTVDLGANNDVTVTSGTVTANLGAVDNAVLDSIDTAVNGTVDVNIVSGGTYNASAPTYADGAPVETQFDVNGNQKVTLATRIAGEDLVNDVMKVEQRFNYLNVAAGTATTTVKTGVGYLHCITINTKGASSNTLTVYDNTAGSGVKIATIDSTDKLGAILYDVSFSVGLTIVSATGTGADYTVSFK